MITHLWQLVLIAELAGLLIAAIHAATTGGDQP